MIYATDEELLKLKAIEVRYQYGLKKIFTPEDYVVLRAGIIRNLYDRGLCNIIFHENELVDSKVSNRKVRKSKR